MRKYQSLIEKIKKQLNIPKKEKFILAPNGTNYKVFLSKNHVIRFRIDNPKLLLKEANFLRELGHSLIPKVLWTGKIDASIAMVENRLPGKNINLVWRTLSQANKINIIKQVVGFLRYLRIQTKNYTYSVHTGKKYKRFLDYLTNDIDKKITHIKRFKQARELLDDLLLIINESEIKNLFIHNTKTTLVHGDLIIHNLLTDGKNLTGILDWEFALFGDPDYDLFRLFYYQECAKAYHEQGADETFEADYMNKLITIISKSELIKDRGLFLKKYRFVRTVFYLNALYWATNSDNPKKNINELVAQWNKKRS